VLLQLAEAQTQLAVARAAAELWQKALEELDRAGPTWQRPLTAPAAGEVTELAAQPGAVIEAGGLVAQVVDFHRALVRLEIPAEALAEGPPSQVELFALPAAAPALGGAGRQPSAGSPAAGARATLVGLAPQVDPASQLGGYWYEVTGTGWRPGVFVQSSLPLPRAGGREAVSLSATALLYHQGRALVYVRLDPGKYMRREVEVLGRDGDRWVVAARQGLGLTGVRAEDSVVYREAQVLLSEEFRVDVDND
jgi:multidrug efflux pump subunit AcrA (membrane-fusion protein)